MKTNTFFYQNDLSNQVLSHEGFISESSISESGSIFFAQKSGLEPEQQFTHRMVRMRNYNNFLDLNHNLPVRSGATTIPTAENMGQLISVPEDISTPNQSDDSFTGDLQQNEVLNAKVIECETLQLSAPAELSTIAMSHNITTTIFDADINIVLPHPSALLVYKQKNLQGLKLIMSLTGQLETIKVVVRNGYYSTFDGISRYLAAKELDWKTLRVEVCNYTDEEIQTQFVCRNYRTKRSLKECCQQAEVILGVLGIKQGKKREKIGDLDLDDENYGLVGKDRFEIACEIIGTPFKASSLRRLLMVNDFEENGNEEEKGLGLMAKLESGEMKINQALDKIKSYNAGKEEQGANSLIEALEYVEGNRFKLYNKTCEDLCAVDDDSVDLSVQSGPYFGQKTYPNGTYPEGVIQHGQEKTVDEYIKKQVEVFRGVYPKLKRSGSLFIVTADSYNGLHCMVSQKLVIAMAEDGWHFVDEWIWKKTNQSPTSVTKRLLPTYEKILHFVKDPQEYYYREFKNWLPDQKFGVKKGKRVGEKKSHGWTLTRPIERFRNFLDEQEVAKIIETSAFNWAELKGVDPKFHHLAPYSAVIPLLPILMTTRPGDTVLDIYSGTGTTASVAVALGRNAIGYDTDTVSLEFAAKRLRKVEENLPTIEEVTEFENEFMIETDS